MVNLIYPNHTRRLQSLAPVSIRRLRAAPSLNDLNGLNAVNRLNGLNRVSNHLFQVRDLLCYSAFTP